jgi:hypothetical protein
MKYVKMFGFAALAAALTAFVAVGNAAATELDNATGMVTTGTTIAAEAETETILHPPIGDIKCKKSLVSGKTTTTGSASETVKGNIEKLTFEECNATVNVLKTGTLEIHTQEASSNNNGTLTSSGTEVTVVLAGFHCIFSTSSTDIGTLTGSANTKSTATFDISAKIPRTGGNSGAFCGSTAEWTGNYKITSPDTLNVT